MYVTLNLDQETITKMKDYYQDDLTKTPDHAIFSAKLTNVVITAYKSGKVLFQGKNAQQEASIWSSESTANTTSDSKANYSGLNIIGCDEVGNGSYFGALVMASVYVPAEKNDQLKQLGIRDSKDMSDKEIQKLAKVIQKNTIHSLTTADPVDYMRGYEEHGYHGSMALMHDITIKKTINKLNDTDPVDGILIDQFMPKSDYLAKIDAKSNPYPYDLYFEKRGESQHIAVAAASILARDTFLNSLERLGEPYGVTLPSGAGPDIDKFGRQMYSKYGQEFLDETAKVHFKNTERIKDQ